MGAWDETSGHGGQEKATTGGHMGMDPLTWGRDGAAVAGGHVRRPRGFVGQQDTVGQDITAGALAVSCRD